MAAASARGSARLRTSSSPTIDPDGIPTAYTVWLVSTGVPNRQYTSAAYSRTVPDTITPKYPPLTSADICRSYSPAAHHAGLRILAAYRAGSCTSAAHHAGSCTPTTRHAGLRTLSAYHIRSCTPAAHHAGLRTLSAYRTGSCAPAVPPRRFPGCMIHFFFAPKYISMKYIFYFL